MNLTAPINADHDRAPAPLFPTARREFLGAPIDCLTLADTIAAADAAMRDRSTLHHVCINVAKFVGMRRDGELDRDVRSSHVISVDGMGIVWGARLLGIPVPERVAGVDVMEGVLRLCQARQYRPYFLGAKPEILRQAVENTRARLPGLQFAGWGDGYFKPNQEDEVVAAIRAVRPDCLFIGMPTPRKERFLARHVARLEVPFVMGVGGGLDVLAGHVQRAPQLVQRLGLEWLFRTVQEPTRLAPRYFKTNAAFAAIMAKAMRQRVLGW